MNARLALPLPAPIPIDRLSERQRRNGIAAIMISTFLSWGGFFMIIPLVAVHYVDHMGWAAGTVGLVLAVRQLTQQGMTAFFGVLADHIGPKPIIATGMLVRAAGFFAMAYAGEFWPVLFAALLAGFGGSMFEAPKAASVAALSRPETRQRLFSMLGVISGAGTTIGTQLGALLIRADFRIVGIAAASAYVVISAVMLVLMPHISVSNRLNAVEEAEAAGSGAGLGAVFRDRDFMLFLLLLTGYWFASSQFGLTIVLVAADITGTDASVSWLYAVNTAITIGLGYVLPRALERWFSPVGLLVTGLGILAAGLLLVGFSDNTVGLLLASAVFSIGAVLARPGQETVTANLARPAARGAYFGVASLSLAVGGGLGNLLGGTLYDLGTQPGMAMVPWLAFFVVGILSSAGIWMLRGRFGVVRSVPLERMAEPPTENAPPPQTAVPAR
jgi:DHA1 family multidrug resistance protein-like MFS transporter